jgi:hypothetical protein
MHLRVLGKADLQDGGESGLLFIGVQEGSVTRDRLDLLGA